MTRKRRRWLTLLACGAGLSIATGLALLATQDSLVFFQSPTELAAGGGLGRMVRLGGLVEAGTVTRETGDRPLALFSVTDGHGTVPVQFAGVLPDLFREGQGIVATGRMRDGTFVATEVLAKHDETYMPAEVADALKKSGQWKPQDGAAPAAATWNAMNLPKAAAPKDRGS